MLLKINTLKVSAKIGLHPWEKAIQQNIIVNLEIEAVKIIDYCSIAKYIEGFAVQQHYEFIEELAELLFNGLQQQFSLKFCKLEIVKPACIPNAASASIVIKIAN